MKTKTQYRSSREVVVQNSKYEEVEPVEVEVNTRNHLRSSKEVIVPPVKSQEEDEEVDKLYQDILFNKSKQFKQHDTSVKEIKRNLSSFYEKEKDESSLKNV